MKKKTLVLALVFGVLAVVAVLALTMPAPAVNKAIGNDELTQLKADGALIVDVRTPEEFAGGHIPDAVNVPMDQLQETAAGWDKSRPLVVYCATGARSEGAAAYLAGQGFEEVYDLTKGIVAWDGEVASGQGSGGVGASAGPIETNGKPLFIDFSSSD